MELENIKLQTTWNDAAASINTNFSKIKRAVRDGIPVVDTPVDAMVSDTSENAIQNKVIKKYVDDEIVSLEGYAEEVVNDLENNIKTNPSEYVKLKTINGVSLLGGGNLQLGDGQTIVYNDSAVYERIAEVKELAAQAKVSSELAIEELNIHLEEVNKGLLEQVSQLMKGLDDLAERVRALEDK